MSEAIGFIKTTAQMQCTKKKEEEKNPTKKKEQFPTEGCSEQEQQITLQLQHKHILYQPNKM